LTNDRARSHFCAYEFNNNQKMIARPRYSGLLRCPSCRMFNRSKDQCVFCDYAPTARNSSSGDSLADMAAAAMKARRNNGTNSEMTPRVLADICREHGARTCNLAVVQLHLNCVGFDTIEGCIAHYPVGAVQAKNAVDPQLESARLQPLSLPLELPEM
jgi:hypothetical protein